MGFLQTLTTATLGLSILYTGSNANLIERQALGPPATLPTGWSYKGCYTYVLLYPSHVAIQDRILARGSSLTINAETLLARDHYKLPLSQVVIKTPKNA